jgi:AcrR family transcriptional regulator
MSTTLSCCDPIIAGPAARAVERRQHLLDTSRNLFIRNGFHGTGVAQIAAASGVKVGQIYRDFSSKEDIIAAIAIADLSQFLDETKLKSAIDAADMDAIREWILAFVTYDSDIDGYRLVPEIMAESSRNPRIAQLQEDIGARVDDALSRALEAYAPGDERAAARLELADLILTLSGGLCQSIVVDAFHGRDYQPLCRRLRAIIVRELDTLRHADS